MAGVWEDCENDGSQGAGCSTGHLLGGARHLPTPVHFTAGSQPTWVGCDGRYLFTSVPRLIQSNTMWEDGGGVVNKIEAVEGGRPYSACRNFI